MRKENTIYLASYFSTLTRFVEVEKFNLLTNNGCIPVAIAKDMLNFCGKYIFTLMLRMEFTEPLLQLKREV